MLNKLIKCQMKQGIFWNTTKTKNVNHHRSYLVKINKEDEGNFQLNRKYCSISFKTPDEDVPTSTFHIKKVLKSSGFTIQEGFTCLSTDCPVCCSSNKPEDKSKVFINKATGNFICQKCQHVTRWSVVEKFFTPAATAKAKKELSKYQELFKDSKVAFNLPELPNGVKDVNDLDDVTFLKILQEFSLPASFQNPLKAVGALYDPTQVAIYIPVKDINKATVAYRVIKKSSEGPVESTLGNTKYGLLSLKTATRGTKEQITAVLVLNVLDLLALGTSKINGEFFK